MYATKFAIVGLVAGVIGIAAAVVTAGSDDSSTVDADVGILLDESTGIAPIEDVVTFFRQRVIDRPSDSASRIQLARALSSQARMTADLSLYEAAEDVARSALEIKPDSAALQLELAGALQAQHRFGEALRIGEAQLADRPSDQAALYLVADTNQELGNYAIAENIFRRLESDSRDAAIVSRLARVAWVGGDNDLAVQLATEASELSGEYSLRPYAKAFYPFQLGHFRFEAGDVDGAIEALRQALEIDPDHAGATEKLAFVLAARGDVDEAMRLYQSLLATGPAADLHGSYADLLRAAGRLDEAAEQEALGLALAYETLDQFPAERRHLVGFFVTREPQTALSLAQQDVEQRRDVGAHDTMAWALHALGRNAEAAEYIGRALELGTRSATILYHAGAIAADLGDTDQALEHLDDALAINPTFAFGDAEDAVRLRAQLAGQLR